MQVNLEIITFIDQIVAEVGKPKHSYDELRGSGGAVCKDERDRDTGGDGSRLYLPM